MVRLSERLSLIAEYLPEETYFADIGSDHAYLPVYYCLNHPEAKALAGEVNEGPLDSAKKVIEEYEVHNRVEARKGDGLDVLEGRNVSEVVIAGMGGPLIASILERGKDRLRDVRRLLLQPNIHSEIVRRWLEENGYALVDEKIIEENNHIYEILIADRDASSSLYTKDHKETELWLGPILMKDKTEVFRKKWERQLKKNTEILHQLERAADEQESKKKEIIKEIDILKEVLYHEND
ncbi:tRNA (adenine(22)-N(1))-methyltransferase [Salimicrobium jeotgali]|uniref:tRNA (adenine(22)-N(1))-methyltransferase n=1 Tax=Salimicrobium jeotgali TaxID=1230341 RepID=UPI000C85DC1B|nr:tRNA (adenine(22)-N(1))-methyltransferase TrmK [Salimicrobium jeotgali]